MNLKELENEEIKNGYGSANASSKVCQDIILKAISSSRLSRNVTIKGGVVMRSKTNDVRRATQDMDIDFIRYSLEDNAIDSFIDQLNVLNDIRIKRIGEISELKQQDYHGKRVLVEIEDNLGNKITSKIDLGVHNRLNIAQEEFCFDIAFDENGASLLCNSNEQMLTEKLKSLLKFGPVSTRFKDIFDIYYLIKHVNGGKLLTCFKEYIFDDKKMYENTIQDIISRLESVSENSFYMTKLNSSRQKWIDVNADTVFDEIKKYFKSLI